MAYDKVEKLKEMVNNNLEKLQKLSDQFKSLASLTRLKMIFILNNVQKIDMKELAGVIGQTKANISLQSDILDNANVVSSIYMKKQNDKKGIKYVGRKLTKDLSEFLENLTLILRDKDIDKTFSEIIKIEKHSNGLDEIINKSD